MKDHRATPLAVAFKEWAVICRALAEGKQALILRKGGVAETTGEFRLEHSRFWLFPTFTHQQQEGIRPEANAWLTEEERIRPAPCLIQLSHFVEVTGIYPATELLPILMLGHLHFWSNAAIEKRFYYRAPGLNVLTARVYRIPEPHLIPNLSRYDGCKSWVELEGPLDTRWAAPVLSDAQYKAVQEQLDVLLRPTAWA